jgi:hypothetical protein
VTVTGKAAASADGDASEPEPAAESPPQAVSARLAVSRRAAGVSRRGSRDVVRGRERERGKGGPPEEAASVAHELPERSMRDPYREGR